MKKTQRLLLSLLILIICSNLFAQKVVTGKVINKETGEPLQGVSVLADKASGGTVTGLDGTFSLKYKTGAGSIVFSSIGFSSQTFSLTSQISFDVSMVPTVVENNEVVVIGYGSQKRSNVTGSVTKYKNESLDEVPVSRLDQALQGKMAGVQIQNISAEAGADPKITIRGISSINAGASPLVVIDGQSVPDGLKFVNMADVESVEVLKDAASAAIYGSRGASGVILITTRSGKSGKTAYRFNSSIGTKTDYKRYDIMTTKEYVTMLFDEAKLKATDPSIVPPTGTAIAPDADRAAYVIEQTLFGGHPEDYQARALKTGVFQNIDISASGGTTGMKYFISGGYQGDEGMMIKSNFEKYNVRAKLDVTFSKKTKLTININPSYDKKTSPSENFTNFVRFPSYLNVQHSALSAAWVRQNPQYASIVEGDWAHPRHWGNQIYSGTMPDGSLWTETVPQGPQDGSSQSNPYSSVINQDIYVKTYRLQSYADLTVNLLPGLDFRSLGSVYMNYGTGLAWANKNATGDGIVSKGVYNTSTFIDLLSENTLNYAKTIKDHSLSVLVGFTAQQTKTSADRVTGLDYPSDDIRTLNNASSIDKSNTFGTKNTVGLLSYLGRFLYSYKNRYLLSASFRMDGSSYFGTGNKWGSFPAVSAGWVASEEKFLKDINWLSRLKIRASYGVSGNNRILDFGYIDLLYSSNYGFGAGNGSLASGQATSSSIIANSNLTWESTFQKNIGFDLSIFKNRINLSMDVYESKTDRLLLQQAALGFTGVPVYWNNIGSLQNRGIEIDLNTNNIVNKNFRWSTSFNFSRTVNKILELGKEAFLLNQGERTEVYRNKVGDPLVQFYGFKTDGIWLSQAEIDAAKLKGLTSNLSNYFIPGGLKIADVNGDNVIDNNDRTIIGNPYPSFTWGITNQLKYKSFDLSFTIQGVQGGDLINGDPNYVEVKKTNRAYNTNRWLSPANPGDGKTPYSSNGYNWMLTDYVVQDGSYYSLREINLGYRLPEDFAKRIGLTSLRFYVAAQNLYFHMASSYKGLNPEGRFQSGPYGSSLIDGYQRGSFPIPKTFVFGLNIIF